jgi:hypothetical protein
MQDDEYKSVIEQSAVQIRQCCGNILVYVTFH